MPLEDEPPPDYLTSACAKGLRLAKAHLLKEQLELPQEALADDEKMVRELAASRLEETIAAEP